MSEFQYALGMNSKFIHLHVHSHYSLLQALPKIDDLVARAKELGMEALALTDYGTMYGIIEFYEACEKAKIKPILGFEAYMALDKHTDRRPRIDDRNHKLVLLAENDEGYKNLMKLTTLAHLDGFYYKPRIDKELLRRHAKGLIGLSAGLGGDIAKALSMDEFGKAEVLAREYEDIFGQGNFFLEVQDHAELDEQNARNLDLYKLSERTGIPLVATKDVHYIKTDDAEAQDLLMCISSGKTVHQDDRYTMLGTDYSFADAGRMLEAFKDHPEAVENTVKIAERCNVHIELGKWNFADYKIPEGMTYDDFLRNAAYEGMKAKTPEMTDEIVKRLDYELDIIGKKGYSPYFLMVADYVQWARAHGIISTTRGSAAGSLVSYAIGITTVNPLAYKLPFERFLNPFRPSPPDVDMDFADERRDEVIAYVTQKYGKDKVAQICTFGTMAARGAVRDAGRALGLAYGFCDRLAKLIPMGSQGFPMTIGRAIEQTPELRKAMNEDPQVKRLLDLAQKIEGCARHVSVHAAGVVIAPRPLTDFTPLQREPGGEKILTQYEMHAVEAAGVLKSDFLGIRNLSILGLAVEIIKKTKGVEIDIQNLPLDDAKTYHLLAEGDTIGLFQLGGAGMTRYLKELKPSNIFDIMAMVALFRPGPMDSIPDFIRRKHNPKLITYLDPRLKDILQMSYGIITYQDDVLLTAIHIAGYNWEEADKLRKAMGKKIPAEMAAQKEKFLSGCVKNGLASSKANELWKLIEPFAAYGFNKAHAASYAIVAYQTAFLKANYPAEFMTAVLTAESGNAETIAEAVTECGKIGIKVLPPDVNSSGARFTYIDDRTIRFGLLAIKNLGSDIIDAIIAEREARGIFKSITELAARIASKNFNKKSLEAMIMSGALDGLGERNQLLTGIEQILAFHKNAVKDHDSGQSSLFGASALSKSAEIVLRPVPPATKREKLAWERELLGLFVSEHPFKEYAEYFSGMIAPISSLDAASAKKGLILVGGIVMESKEITTKKNDLMAFVRLEDSDSAIEVVVFPSVYKTSVAAWAKDSAVLVYGKFEEKEGEKKILAEKVKPLTPETLEAARNELAFALRLHAPNAAHGSGRPTSLTEEAAICIAVPPTMPNSFAEELKRIFAAHPGGRKVYLVVRDPAASKKIATSFSIALGSDTVADIERLVGKGAVLVGDAA